MLETGWPVTKLSERKPRAAGSHRRDDRRPMSELTRVADPWSGHAGLRTTALRRLVAETSLDARQLVLPLFVRGSRSRT